jgi:hypothetical protein
VLPLTFSANSSLINQSQQQMQNVLQGVQLAHRIYNSDIEPEHDVDTFCGCDIHQYMNLKVRRLNVQNGWSEAVMYPGKRHCEASDCSSAQLTDSQAKRHIITATRQLLAIFSRTRTDRAFIHHMATLLLASWVSSVP